MLNTTVLTKTGKKFRLSAQQVGFINSKKISQIMLVTDKSIFVLDTVNVEKISIRKNNCISQWCNNKWTKKEVQHE